MGVGKANNQKGDGANGAVDASKPLRTIKLPEPQDAKSVNFDLRFRIQPSKTRVIMYYFCEHLQNANDALRCIPAFFVEQKVKQICKENGAFRNMERLNRRGSNEYPHAPPYGLEPLANISNPVTFPLVLGDIWRKGQKPGAVRVVRGKKANGEIIHDIIYHAKPNDDMKMATLKAGRVLPYLQIQEVPGAKSWN
ncbi:hypothetical protein V8F06_002737 [Rhypophila decipiens]